MKIRTDFVTNSSSSSFITVLVNDDNLANAFGFASSDEMNSNIKKAIYKWYDIYEYTPPFGFITGIDGLFTLLSINDDDIFNALDQAIEKEGEADEYLDLRHEHNDDPNRYLSKPLMELYKANHPEIANPFTLNEGDIKSLDIDYGYHWDGDFGPFKHINITNGKRTEFSAYDTWDDSPIRNENIEGAEFFFLGDKIDFEDYTKYIDCVKQKGGIVVDAISANTDYVVLPEGIRGFYRRKNVIHWIEIADKFGVPCITETAFGYRWLNESLPESLYDLAILPREYEEYYRWFLEYGYGIRKIQIWNKGHWTSLNRANRKLSALLEKRKLESEAYLLSKQENKSIEKPKKAIKQQKEAEPKLTYHTNKKSCSGLQFAVNGKLSNFVNHLEFIKCVTELGGKATGQISSNTDYFVCNDPLRSTQYNIAINRDIPIISEKEFISLFIDVDNHSNEKE